MLFNADLVAEFLDDLFKLHYPLNLISIESFRRACSLS